MERCLPSEPAAHVAGVMLSVCLVLAAATGRAFAHGDAAWIMEEPRYVTGAGSHCCGPTDCERVPDGEVVEVRPGEWLVRSTHQVFRQDQKGVYPSKQGSFWWCRRGARVVCLFYDTGGF
ncbi:hypothetical protein [Desertibaculum subflavum]|uniref:hypothetical protein n=1 Tax=Desertibaculum subflavum TaxID=2268458 RepID=UPI0013C52757